MPAETPPPAAALSPAVREALERFLRETSAALQGPWKTEAAVREVAGTVAGVLTAASLGVVRNRGISDYWVDASIFATELDLLTAHVRIYAEGQRAAGGADNGRADQ